MNKLVYLYTKIDGVIKEKGVDPQPPKREEINNG